MNAKLWFLAAIGLSAYAIWGAIAFFIDRTQLAEFQHFTMGIATGVVGLVLRDMQPPGKSKNGDGDAAQ